MEKQLTFIAITLVAVLFSTAASAETLSLVEESWWATTEARNVILAFGAFAGFFGGTLIKYFFDLRLDHVRKNHEKHVLAAEILATLRRSTQELISIRSNFSMHYDQDVEENDAGWRKWTADIDHISMSVFESSLGKLGLLGPKTASLTVEIFLGFEELNNFRNDVLNSHKTYRQDSTAILFGQATGFVELMIPKVQALDKELSCIAGTKHEPIGEQQKRFEQERRFAREKGQLAYAKAKIMANKNDTKS